MGLHHMLQSKKLVVCCGAGGVGKTTSAAALAVRAAMEGRRVMVLTIDPARRLANALGLEQLGNDERLVPPEVLAASGVEVKGELWAAMLDSQAAFDDLIRRTAPSPEAYRRIMDNGVYRQLSSTLSGTQEYMAIEKLYDIWTGGRYDLIVLDTPPTVNALDFLQAPNRLARFLDENVMKWFTPLEMKRGIKARVMRGTRALVDRLLSHLLGGEFVRELGEFFFIIKDIRSQFLARAELLGDLLRSSDTVFILVTSAEEGAMQDAAFFHRKLQEMELSFGAFVVNRVHTCDDHRGELADPVPPGPAGAPEVSGAATTRAAGVDRGGPGEGAEQLSGLMVKLERNYLRQQALAARDRDRVERFCSQTEHEGLVRTVPLFAEDIHDVRGLLMVDHHLSGSGELT